MAAKKTEAAKPAARKRTTRAKKTELTHDRIAERAYFLHLESGADPLDDWLRAERELATA